MLHKIIPLNTNLPFNDDLSSIESNSDGSIHSTSDVLFNKILTVEKPAINNTDLIKLIMRSCLKSKKLTFLKPTFQVFNFESFFSKKMPTSILHVNYLMRSNLYFNDSMRSNLRPKLQLSQKIGISIFNHM